MIKKLLFQTIITFAIYSLLFAEEPIRIVKKQHGWNIPNINQFHTSRVKSESYKNCTQEGFLPNNKVTEKWEVYYYQLENGIVPSIEIKLIKEEVTHLNVFYYKDRAFCYQYVNTDKHLILGSYFDMDLDGIFESQINGTDPMEYFLKIFPKVSEEDRYRREISLGGYTIK